MSAALKEVRLFNHIHSIRKGGGSVRNFTVFPFIVSLLLITAVTSYAKVEKQTTVKCLTIQYELQKKKERAEDGTCRYYYRLKGNVHNDYQTNISYLALTFTIHDSDGGSSQATVIEVSGLGPMETKEFSKELWSTIDDVLLSQVLIRYSDGQESIEKLN